MDVEHEIILSLLRFGIKGETCQIPQETDWNKVLDLAFEQGVVGVCFDAVEHLPEHLRPDGDTLMEWFGQVSMMENDYKQHADVVQELVNFYSSYGIKMMVLKGWGLSLYYPRPSYRPTGDLDIWLFGNQEKADKLLMQEKNIVALKSSHHTVFFYKGVEVENHITFFEVDCHKPDGSEESIIQYLNEEQNKYALPCGGFVYLPRPNLNAYFLLRHSSCHFATERITLRHLLDWGFFVEKEYNVINWGNLYKEAAERNMNVFLDCQNSICVDYLGFSKDKFPIRERHDELEKRIFMDILSPEFSLVSPKMSENFIKYCYIKARRHFANKWKYDITYKENIWSIFWRFGLNRIKNPYGFSVAKKTSW